MPLDSIEDYDRLGEHLAEIDAPLAAFAAKHGYTVCPRLSGGRYPNRRITQEGSMFRSIHITMDESPSGERYDHFFPAIPYTMWGGAWIDDHEQRIRFSCASVLIRAVPFTLLARTLRLHLRHFHGYLSGISEDYIRACAITSPLGPLPA
jgi:hypothetical protein